MKLKLIEIKTDTIPLDGLFYEPEEKPAKGSVMICHGNTMNFKLVPHVFYRLNFAN